MVAKKKRPKKKKSKLTAEEKLRRKAERKHFRDFREFFRNLGFIQIKSDGIQIQVSGRTGELDDVFIHKNVVVLVEYSTGKPASSHILKKMPLFQNILKDVPNFLNVARAAYPNFSREFDPIYGDEQFHIRIIYAPLLEAAQETIDACPDIVFLQGGLTKYFSELGKTIQRSGCVEFFSFLKLDWSCVGEAILTASGKTHEYLGQLLPKSMSSFPTGYKVVSFYADPETLIAGAYVLRRDGWRDASHLYQRVLVKNKISKMRHYLAEQERVFVNNVIVTLPANTPLNEPNQPGKNISNADLTKAQPVIVQIPSNYNTLGIVDGQHRIFCYHEGDDTYENKIKLLRKKQHLLVTGIIYPDKIQEDARLEFEARLFLEINDTQTRAQPALRQDIETIVRPFSGVAVARRIIAQLAKHGPYKGLFQLAYFDSPKKIKTSSIVSYGLRPLVKFDGDDSLFSAWSNTDKQRLKAREKKSARTAGYDGDLALLNEYVNFCVKNLNDFFVAAKLAYGTEHWDVDDTEPSTLLRPTSINGLIACFRKVIKANLPLHPADFKKGLSTIKKFDFQSYKSSSWEAMGRDLFENHYEKNSGS